MASDDNIFDDDYLNPKKEILDQIFDQVSSNTIQDTQSNSEQIDLKFNNFEFILDETIEKLEKVLNIEVLSDEEYDAFNAVDDDELQDDIEALDFGNDELF